MKPHVIGYFRALAEWTLKRSAALKAVRKAYLETQEKPWRVLSTKASKKREADTGERLRQARAELSDTEHTKPERPELTRDLFKFGDEE